MEALIPCPIRKQALENGQAVAAAFERDNKKKSISFTQLDKLINEQQRQLAALGIIQGTTFAYLPNAQQAITSKNGNSIAHLVLLFSALRLGAIFCPLNPLLTSKQVTQQLSFAGIKHLLYDVRSALHAKLFLPPHNITATQVNINQEIEKTPSLNTTPDLYAIQKLAVNYSNESKAVQNNAAQITTSKIHEEKPKSRHSATSSDYCDRALKSDYLFFNERNPLTVVFTSGSTGQAKAAVHSFANHYYSALGSQQCITLASGDCWLASLPFYHIGGLAIIMRTMFAGASIYLPSQLTLNEVLTQSAISHISLVPTQLSRLIKDNILPTKPMIDGQHCPHQRTLKYILLGGAPLLRNNIPAKIMNNINIFYSYGLTEMSSQVATCPLNENGFNRPLKYRAWRISNNELYLSGKTLFLGYMQQGKIINATTNGWFASKDLVIKNKGKISIVGRKDNMFICGGENYQPEIVERALNAHPEVTQAIVVPISDADFGQIPVAFIQWQNSPALSKLKADLTNEITPWQRPKAYYPWPSKLPVALKLPRQYFINIATNMSP